MTPQQKDSMFIKMIAATYKYTEKKEAHEILWIRRSNLGIRENFTLNKEDHLNALSHIYHRIIKQLSLNQTEGEYDIEKFSASAMIVILKEYFPTSEFTFYSDGDYSFTSHDILRFKITVEDMLLNKNAIDQCKVQYEKKENSK